MGNSTMLMENKLRNGKAKRNIMRTKLYPRNCGKNSTMRG